jgi:hypothetical protein
MFLNFRTDFVLFGTILWQRKTESAIVKSTRKLSKNSLAGEKTKLNFRRARL